MDRKARLSEAPPISPSHPRRNNDTPLVSPSSSLADAGTDHTTSPKHPSSARLNGAHSARTLPLRSGRDDHAAVTTDSEASPPPSAAGNGLAVGWDPRADSERDEGKRFPSHALSWGGDSGGNAEAEGGRSLASSVRSIEAGGGARAGSSRVGEGDRGGQGKGGRERTLRKRRKGVAERERETVSEKGESKRLVDVWGFRRKGGGTGEESGGK